MTCPCCTNTDLKTLGHLSCKEGVLEYYKCRQCEIFFTEDRANRDEEDIL